MISLTKRQVVILLGVILILAVLGWLLYQHNAAQEARIQQAALLSEQQAKDMNSLQNELKLSKQNAELLAKFIQQAQANQVQPVTHFTVQAPALPQAAQQVQERIIKNDPTLPPAAIEKTDRTVVTPNETQFKVDVYKYNGYRNWEWSVGYGQHGGDKYVPVEIQRNYSKNAAVSYEHHFGGKSGFEVKYTRKTDKLFVLF